MPNLKDLIYSFQTDFIIGHEDDNVIILRKVLHFIKKKMAKKECIILKIDLEKAYLKNTSIFYISKNLIALIMSCISSTSISTLFNGVNWITLFLLLLEVSEKDSISPFSFILFIKYLPFLIDEQVVSQSQKVIKVGRGSIPVTHLFFANDLILMTEGTDKKYESILSVFNNFCSSSCQKLIFFFFLDEQCLSQNYVPTNVRNTLSNLLYLKEVNNFGSYLSFSTGYGTLKSTPLALSLTKLELNWQVGEPICF